MTVRLRERVVNAIGDGVVWLVWLLDAVAQFAWDLTRRFRHRS